MKNGLVIFLFFTTSLTAQTVAELTESLTKGIADDSQKLVRIYDWVTKNIVYDHHFLRNRVEGDTVLMQEPYNVVVRKKAICMGYAKLFRAMCQAANISAMVVVGWTKSNSRQLDTEEHAWNSVKINDEWYLVDATWGASGGEMARKYFLTPPSVFLENHFPHDPMWQLTQSPTHFDCFSEGKNCFLNEKKLFNYRDTIASWLKMDSLTQMYDSGQRALRFFPNDVEAIRNMANAHSGQALMAYSTYFKIRDAVVSKKKEPIGREEVLALLANAQFHLMQAKALYERLITFARPNELTDAHLNRDVMAENILKLEDEREFVFRVFKK